MVKLAFMGDVMLGRGVCRFVEQEPPEYVWGDALDDLVEADVRFANLECVIAECGQPVQPKTFHFRAVRKTMDALEAARLDVISLANNHVLDYGEDALLEMLDLLDERGMPYAGAGRNAEEAWRPAFFDRQGLRIGVLAFTDNVPDWEAGDDKPGVAYVPVEPDSSRFESFLERVRSAAAGCDLLVVSAHWGPNMRREPPEHFQRFARGVLDAGANVYWGHSAHLFQGVERRGGGVILYDTGDFVDDYHVDAQERNDLGFLFLVDVEPTTAVGEIEMRPVSIDPARCQVNRARDADFDWASWRMAELCTALGTPIDRVPQGVRVPLPEPRARPARRPAPP